MVLMLLNPLRFQTIKRTNNRSTQRALKRISAATCFDYSQSHHRAVQHKVLAYSC